MPSLLWKVLLFRRISFFVLAFLWLGYQGHLVQLRSSIKQISDGAIWPWANGWNLIDVDFLLGAATDGCSFFLQSRLKSKIDGDIGIFSFNFRGRCKSYQLPSLFYSEFKLLFVLAIYMSSTQWQGNLNIGTINNSWFSCNLYTNFFFPENKP